MLLEAFRTRCAKVFDDSPSKPIRLESLRYHKPDGRVFRLLEQTSWFEIDGWFLREYDDIFFDLDENSFFYFLPGIMCASLEAPNFASNRPAGRIEIELFASWEARKFPNVVRPPEHRLEFSRLNSDQLVAVRDWCEYVLLLDGFTQLTEDRVEELFLALLT